MDSKICVDASFILKLVLPEDYSDKVHLMWNEWVEKEASIYAPYLLIYETGSVIRNKIFRDEIALDEGKEAARVLNAQEVIFYHSQMIEERAWDLAVTYEKPTLYDAFYLAVAEEIGAEFWTADKRLVNSLKKEIPWVKSVFD